MTRRPLIAVIAWLLGTGVLFWTPKAVPAASLTVFGSEIATFDLSAGPPPPSIPEYDFFSFDLSGFYPGAFPGQTSPNVLPKGFFAETQTSFQLGFVSPNPIVASQNFEFTLEGSYWSVFLASLNYNPATSPIFDSDVLTFSGIVRHTVGPHEGDDPLGPPLPYRIELHGGRVLTAPEGTPQSEVERIIREANIPAGVRVGIDLEEAVQHPSGSHRDNLYGWLAGVVANPSVPFISNEIVAWEGGVFGNHVVPEPSALAVLGTGLLSVVGLLCRRRGV